MVIEGRYGLFLAQRFVPALRPLCLLLKRQQQIPVVNNGSVNAVLLYEDGDVV